MDRGEGAGLAVAVVGHVALLGLLSATFLATPEPEALKATPIEVSLATEIGMENAAPEPSSEPLAAKKSPEEAPVEPEPAPALPEPAPKPEPAPPKPKPEPPKPKPEPAPVAKPQPPAKPSKPAPATPTKPSTSARPNAATQPSTSSRTPVKPTGNLDGLDLGRSNNKTDSTSTKPPASATGAEMASYTSAILRQVQPCANRQVTPGPGAERIRVTVQLSLNRDGSLAGEPQIVAVDGDDADNSRYVARVRDLARAVFKGCSPLIGLPADLYDVPRGWKTVRLRYKLPG